MGEGGGQSDNAYSQFHINVFLSTFKFLLILIEDYTIYKVMYILYDTCA